MNYSEHYTYKCTMHQEGINASKREGRGRGYLSVGYDSRTDCICIVPLGEWLHCMGSRILTSKSQLHFFYNNRSCVN